MVFVLTEGKELFLLVFVPFQFALSSLFRISQNRPGSVCFVIGDYSNDSVSTFAVLHSVSTGTGTGTDTGTGT